ncbi:TetR/AcrR family transcriptional regulator [Polaromonas sp. A23]|uniref:TetR/AcrR family transcriptional regulator n=1 Tax=Polaromonas sp. A23 TaxID=1944133 RepID=UPI000985C916|nr:TetR/AcrR family transcriptional regulator [Polaromonas sp. A23]OOG43910.1 TetR family transcriptional regulator [Polaromonas sp. A23]
MREKPTNAHIVEAADQLFYENGFEHTSFSDIANSVNISRGNFYYHFQTKDDILSAVINLRLANTQNMLSQWELDSEDPVERIRSFINLLIANQALIMQFGCPVGTLCTELAKLSHASKEQAALLFSLFGNWLTKQFEALGFGAEANTLATHALVCSQGVATLANAFGDARFVSQEVRQMHEWLDRVVAARDRHLA